MAKQLSLATLEKHQSEEDDADLLPPSDIIAFNELRSGHDILRMHNDDSLNIKPDFQREFVWKTSDQTRFIDSLIKRLPIPSMCFSLDSKTDKYQVIDGLQRIHTIVRFLDIQREEDDWQLTDSDDVDNKIAGKYVSEIKSDNYDLYKRVLNVMLPVTVLRCDTRKKSHTNYLFTIFRRLNTGGMKLTNQEIRNCIYIGPFNDFLKECNGYERWRRLLNINDKLPSRFQKEELILRIFAFLENIANYNGKLAKFLNEYMDDKRDSSKAKLAAKKILFTRAVDFVYEKITSNKALDKKYSIAFTEALFYGIISNIDHLENLTKQTAQKLFDKMLKNVNFSEEALSEGLAGRDKVNKRLNVAKKIFGSR